MKLHVDQIKHFKRHEFACKCGCGFDAVDIELLGVLADIRKHFDSKVFILSGCRCRPYNVKINGSENSQHIYAKAADIRVKDIEPGVVAQYLEEKYNSKYGIGKYSTWTHIDVRLSKARWDKK